MPPYFPALILCGLEDHERAVERLEHGYEIGDTMLRDLKAYPPCDRMRNLPQFAALMQRMAFPPARREAP